MEFNFVKTIVSALVFGFFLFIIVNHIINTWFSGALHESDRNRSEGFEDATTAPTTATLATSAPSSTTAALATSAPSSTTAALATSMPTTIDSGNTISNSEIIANLFDRVNTQLDIVRTLKEPYTDSITTIQYNRDLSGNMMILSNIKMLVAMGVDSIDKDLQSNPGITKMFQYAGNDSVKEVITDLASLDETKLDALCKKNNTSACDKIESATDKETCIAKVKKQCLKDIEASYLKRVTSIVDGHQRIIDRILEKQSRN